MKLSKQAKCVTYGICRWCDYTAICDGKRCVKNKAAKTKSKNFLKKEMKKEISETN